MSGKWTLGAGKTAGSTRSIAVKPPRYWRAEATGSIRSLRIQMPDPRGLSSIRGRVPSNSSRHVSTKSVVQKIILKVELYIKNARSMYTSFQDLFSCNTHFAGYSNGKG